MAKSRIRTNSLRNRRKKTRISNQTHVENSKISLRDRFKKFFSSTWVIITSIGVIIGIVSWFFSWKDVKDNFTPPSQVWEDHNFINGILIPNTLDDDKLYISAGGFGTAYSIADFKNGVIFRPHGFVTKSGNDILNFVFKLNNNRLYVSTKIRYILNDELVGVMDFNRWSLFKSNILNYPYYTDTSLEVIDKQNNVCFSLVFKKSNVLEFKGYFILDEQIVIFNDNTIQSFAISDRQKAIQEARKIKPTFKYLTL